jgi:hypothetical protein
VLGRSSFAAELALDLATMNRALRRTTSMRSVIRE